MSVVDLLKMSLSSLWRRKLRTILTILGVVIGTASIVVMISLGLGLNRSMMEQIEEYGGITTINVYGGDSGYYGYEVAVAVDSDSEQQEPVRIDDAAIEAFSQMEHVELASPVLSIYVAAKQGVWENTFNIQGMSQEALHKMNLEVRLPAQVVDVRDCVLFVRLSFRRHDKGCRKVRAKTSRVESRQHVG